MQDKNLRVLYKYIYTKIDKIEALRSRKNTMVDAIFLSTIIVFYCIFIKIIDVVGFSEYFNMFSLFLFALFALGSAKQ